jgi:hypothetical protein
MGTKRGAGRGSFIGSVTELIDAFYGKVIQTLKPWSPPAPRMRTAEPQAPEATALSSQDGVDTDLAERSDSD